MTYEKKSIGYTINEIPSVVVQSNIPNSKYVNLDSINLIGIVVT